MLSTALVILVVWLPLATTLEAVVTATSRPFATLWKRALYVCLAAPALLAGWLTAILARNQRTVDRLHKVGEWFKA